MKNKILRFLRSKNGALTVMLFIVAILVIVCIAVGAGQGCSSCDEPEPVDTEKTYLNLVLKEREAGAKVMTYDAETKTYFYSLDKDENRLDLNEFFDTSEKAKWAVYTDEMGSSEASTKVLVNFQNGENIYYVTVRTLDERELRNFTVRLYKAYDVTVRFIGLKGQVYDSQTDYAYSQLLANVYGASWTDGSLTISGDTVLGEGNNQAFPVCNPVGYTFGGWTVNGEVVEAPYKLTENVDFVAKLTPIVKTVELNGGGADNFTETQKEIEFDSAFELPVPTKKGHTFLGWAVDDRNTNPSDVTFVTYVDGKSLGVFDQLYEEFFAQWHVNKYEVTLESDTEGAGTLTGAGTYDYGTHVEITATPNPGYTFLDWYDAVDTEKAIKVTNFNMYDHDVSYIAKWAHYELKTVKSDENAGTVSNGDFYTAGVEVTLTATTRESYTFLGWYENNTCVSEEETFKVTMPKSDVTYEARWAHHELTVAAITDKYAPITGEEVTVSGGGFFSKGKSVSVKAETHEEGYEFKGWYTLEGGKYNLLTADATYTGAMPNASVTYYAMWEVKKRNAAVSFNSVGGTACSTQYVMTFDAAQFPVPTRTGYTFVGWYHNDAVVTGADGKLNKSTFFDDVTLTAKWSAVTVLATLNANGGAVSGTSQNITFDSKYTLPVPTRTGYDFVGWEYNGATVTDANGVSVAVSKFDSNVTLKAKWSAIDVTFSFDSGEGTAVSPVTVKYDAVNVQLPLPELDGMAFGGWLNGEVVITGTDGVWAKVTYASAVTFTAKWIENKATYIKNDNVDGEEITVGPKEVVADRGATSVDLYRPNRPGYVFGGWFLDSACAEEDRLTDKTGVLTESTMVGDVQIYAKWTPKSIQVTVKDVNYNDTNKNNQIASIKVDGSGYPNATTKTYKYGDSITVEAIGGEGCTFMGWYHAQKNAKLSDNLIYVITLDEPNVDSVVYEARFKNDYDLIENANDLKNIAAEGDYMLANDITLTGLWTPLLPDGFNGKLIGAGYRILGLDLEDSVDSDVGLFAKVNAGAEIVGLNIVNPVMNVNYDSGGSTERHYGIIAGVNYGKIVNCTVSGADITINESRTLKHLAVGGIVGFNANGNAPTSGGVISNCTFDGTSGFITVTATSNCLYVGAASGINGALKFKQGGKSATVEGTVAKNVTVTVTNKLSPDASLNQDYAIYTYVGGFVGYNTDKTINCAVSGKVKVTATEDVSTSSNSNQVVVGGFTGGIFMGSVDKAYANCTVTVDSVGTAMVGGLVGNIDIDSSSVTNACVNGSVTVTNKSNANGAGATLVGKVYGNTNPQATRTNLHYATTYATAVTFDGTAYGLTDNDDATAKNGVNQEFLKETVGLSEDVASKM